MNTALGTLSRTIRLIPSTWLYLLAVIAAIGLVLGGSRVLRIKDGPSLVLSVPSIAGLTSQGDTNAQSKLYVLSEVIRPDGSGSSEAGHVTIYDAISKQEIYTIPTGVDVDAVASPDGSRVYIASVSASSNCDHGGDVISAFDTRTKSEVWHVSDRDRVKYIGGGLSTLGLSPDGNRLYVYSYPWCSLESYSDASEVPYWVGSIDTRTGQLSSDRIPLGFGCNGGSLTIDPAGLSLSVACSGSSNIRFINLQTHQMTQQLAIPSTANASGTTGGIVGALQSADKSNLYVVTSNFKVAVIDLKGESISRIVDLNHTGTGTIADGLIALSSDGKALIASEPIEDSPGHEVANEIHAYDTNTWMELNHLRVDEPLVRTNIAVDPNGKSLYAITVGHNGTPLPSTDTLLSIGLADGQTQSTLVRKGEGIIGMFFSP